MKKSPKTEEKSPLRRSTHQPRTRYPSRMVPSSVRSRKKNEELAKIAIDKFIMQSFEIGWDDMYGGIIYMLDANGYSPTQLEWNMKLWWPHADALIAFLMAYKETRDENFIKKFDLVFQYTLLTCKRCCVLLLDKA